MAEETSIESLHEFINWVELTKNDLEKEAQEPLAFFYRGHSDRKYSLEPSAYRIDKNGNSYRAVEYYLYQEMLRREPEAFNNDKSIFEQLVRMQHHGLPTRLLDLTKNALVALFFACESNRTDGQVMFFHSALSQVLFPTNIPGPSLSGLETKLDFFNFIDVIMGIFVGYLENQFKQLEKLSYGCNDFRENFRKNLKSWLDIIASEQCKNIEQKIYFFKDIEKRLLPDFFAYWENNFLTCDKKPCYDKTNAPQSINILLKFMVNLNEQRDSSLKLACENLKFPPSQKYNSYSEFIFDFFKLYFIQPPNNNERVRRQHGAFFLIPPLKGKSAMLEDIYTPVTIRIKRKAKERIKEQLSHMGITRAYLFPDLEEQARDIRICYPPRPAGNVLVHPAPEKQA